MQCYLMSSRTPQLLIQTLNVNKNYQIKRYGQGRRRRPLWISFQLTVLLTLFIHMTFAKSLVKKWTGRIVSNSLFLREVTCCYKRLREFSVTKPICYKDVFVNSFCSPTSRLANSLVVEPVLWLITKWLSNLELIPSSLRQNNNGDIFRIQFIVFGHLRTLTTS